MTAAFHDDRPRRRAPLRSAVGRSVGKWAVIVGSIVLLVTLGLPRLFGGIGAMFTEREVDRSGPVLLQAISDLADYDAAAANLQVLVDLERDTRYVPAAIKGSRTMYLAEGVARAGVSFGDLTADRIVVDPATRAVTITLPHARITGVTLDARRSKVMQHKRGLLDRIGSAVGDDRAVDAALLVLAEDRLQMAAARSDVIARAEDNTAQMLRSLVVALGHPAVTVRFADPVAAAVSASSPSAREL